MRAPRLPPSGAGLSHSVDRDRHSCVGEITIAEASQHGTTNSGDTRTRVKLPKQNRAHRRLIFRLGGLTGASVTRQKLSKQNRAMGGGLGCRWGRPCSFPPSASCFCWPMTSNGDSGQKWARLATSRQISVFPATLVPRSGPASLASSGGGEQMRFRRRARWRCGLLGASSSRNGPTTATSQRGLGITALEPAGPPYWRLLSLCLLQQRETRSAATATTATATAMAATATVRIVSRREQRFCYGRWRAQDRRPRDW